MNDRVFTIAFAVSLGIHLALILGQLFSISWLTAPTKHAPLEVVYEYEVAKQELRQLEEQLSRAKRETVASPSAPILGERMEIRVPDRPSLTADRSLSDLIPTRSSIVDLTNLVDASRGDPVLLNYFGAIREQIQRTANRRPWLASEGVEGLVYVSFVLSSTGEIHGLSVVSETSVPSDTLRDVALRIVETAAPFPPFPPSLPEPSKTIVVPLEFLLGS